MDKKLQKPYPTDYNLLIVQDFIDSTRFMTRSL